MVWGPLSLPPSVRGGIQAFSRKWNTYSPLCQCRVLEALSHVVSWAKTCAKVTHLLSLAHLWKGESNGGERRSQRWPDAGPDAVSVCRSVFSVCACLGFLIRRGGTSGHGRPDVSGRWGCLLDSDRTLALWRPVRAIACPVTASLERCSGLTSASGPLRDQRVRSSFARPVSATSAESHA
jgi:hypothetical protein